MSVQTDEASYPIDLTKYTPSCRAAWKLDSDGNVIRHLGSTEHRFNTLTFPETLVNGEFSAKVTIDHARRNHHQEDCSAHIVFRHLDGDRYYAFGIGGWQFNYSSFVKRPNMAFYAPWKAGGCKGDERHYLEPSFNQEVEIRVRLRGSVIEGYLNGTRMMLDTFPPGLNYRRGNLGLYAYAESPVAFSDLTYRPTPQRCFIVSRIHKEYDREHYEPLKARIENEFQGLDVAGVGCFRADNNTRSEPFIRTIIEEMKAANLTIVLVPGKPDSAEDRNENVFYELGIAHAMSLPTLIHAENYERLPADLRHLNIITTEEKLIQSIRQVLESDTYDPVYVA